MLKKTAKRFLIMLPAAWLLATAVFLWSKSMPGASPELQFEQNLESANSSAKAEARKRAYRQMLHRTGQDLPLFYFHIGTAAEPDSLHRILPETDRSALKKLLHQYGNWPEIAAYYQTWQHFRQNISSQPETGRTTISLANRLLSEPEKSDESLAMLQKTLCFSPEKPACRQITLLQSQLHAIRKNKVPALNYQPRFFWHGTQNQYHSWLRQLFQGDLGYSTRDMRPVSAIISEAFGITFQLALCTFILTAISGPAIAMVLSRKSAGKFQKPALNSLYILESIPLFILALFLLAFASYQGWLRTDEETTGLLLAILVLTAANLPYFTSQAFTALQHELQQQYILTAKAKGLSETSVLHHAFRNSLLPDITLLADFLPALLAGAVVLEVIFSLPGMGRLLIDAVLSRDYAVITGLVLITGLIKMAAHILSDIFYNLADPRVNA